MVEKVGTCHAGEVSIDNISSYWLICEIMQHFVQQS
jgi:hypothetical protein